MPEMSWGARWRGRAERLRARRARRAQERARCRAERREWRRTGEGSEDMAPAPGVSSLLPWLLLGLGAASNLLQGRAPNPWIGGLGLLAFNSLYISVVVRAFVKETREAVSTRVALALMGLITCGLALGYGGSWLYFFPLLGLATGAVLRGPWLGRAGLGLTVLAAAVSAVRAGWDAVDVAYGTFLSTMVTAAILSLADAVRQLRAAREELARRAVDQERLRFSRDLHDLLGHTMSVIVVKSEAARRLAPRDLDAALAQINDIESVGRQALAEIREAVTGYREGSLTGELDRARSALRAAGVEPVVREAGPPPEPQAAALLGWVVREAVTNVLRHSGATRCEIAVEGTAEGIRLTVTDDGTGGGADGGGESGAVAARGGVPGSPGPALRSGTGLTGLRERLAAAGGSLSAGPESSGGFTVTAELPADACACPAAGAVLADEPVRTGAGGPTLTP